MKLTRFIYILAVFTSVIVFTSCGEEDFLDINENPNSSVNADADLLFTGAIVEHSNGRTQYLQQYCNYWTQHFVSGNASALLTQWEEYNRNGTLFSIWTNNFWGEYGSIQSLVLAEDEALRTGFLNTAAQAKILKSQFYLDMTLIWEDIPYSQANNLGFNNPEFDTQDEIFEGLIAELDSAILIAEPGQGGAVEAGDLIYGGDMNKWVKYANSLKFYILMLQANAGENVDAELQATLNAGVFESRDDNAFVEFFDVPGQQNPGRGLFDQFGGAWVIEDDNAVGQGFAFYLSDNFAEVLTNYNGTVDPRIELFFAIPDGQTDYFSVDINEGATTATAFVDENFYNATYPDFLLTYSEIQLLIAEARVNGNVTGDASVAYENGVKASFARYNSLATGRTVAAADFDAYFATELSGQVNSPANTALATTSAEHIHMQQYINGFLMGLNSWTTWRKNNIIPLDIIPTSVLGDVVRRFPYDQEEPNININFPETVKPLDEPMYFEN